LALQSLSYSLSISTATIAPYPLSLHDALPICLRAITEHLAPGQWDVARKPTRKELASSSVLAIPLEEASVKIRQGPPGDDDEDYALDVWAGVVPVHQVFGAPCPDPALRPGIPVPPHIARLAAP